MRGTTFAAAVCAFALAAPAAHAGTVQRGDFQVGFYDDKGDDNDLTVTETATHVVFHDAAKPITKADGCEPDGPNTVRCPIGTELEIQLRDGKDDLTLNLLAGGPFDTSDGEGSHPMVYGGAGDDTVHGSAIAENIYGGADGDTILAGAGNDFITANAGEDMVFGGAGDDAIYTAYDGYETGPLVDGGDSAAEADTYSGGSGRDSLTYGYRTVNLSITADGVADDGAALEHDLVGADVENLFGGTGNDIIEGTATPDRNEGYPDTVPGTDLYGGGGNDRLVAGAGDDGLDGGLGNDELLGGPGRDSMRGDEGNDTLVGGTEPDHMTGDNGDDSIDARDGSTFLRIGPADDWVTCGIGEDTYLADYSEIQRLIPGEMGDGCDHHNDPPDPAHLLVPDKSGSESEGDVSLGVGCPEKAMGSCGGTVQVTVPAPVSAAKAGKRPPLVLAQGSVQLKRGHHKRAKLTLTKEGRKYFKHHAKAVARALAKSKYSDLKRLKGHVKIRVKD